MRAVLQWSRGHLCGCTVLLIGTCDCNGNMLDAIGVCGGDCLIDWDGDGLCDSGCTEAAACNYDARGGRRFMHLPGSTLRLRRALRERLRRRWGVRRARDLRVHQSVGLPNETCGAGSYNPAATEDDGVVCFNILVRPLPAYRLQLSVQEMQMEMASATTSKMRSRAVQPGACNYGGPVLCFDDGSCEYESCQGAPISLRAIMNLTPQSKENATTVWDAPTSTHATTIQMLATTTVRALTLKTFFLWTARAIA